MCRKYRNTIIFCIFIFVLSLSFTGVCNAQVIWPSIPLLPVYNTLPVGITYTPDPLLTLGSLPPIYPFVGDTIAAFDSFVWPAGAGVPATSLADISYAVPGTFSGYPGLIDPQIYLSTSWPLYIDYMNLYFSAAPAGSTLPGAFGPFGSNSVNAYAGLALVYPYYNYVDILQLLNYYTLNPISTSYVTSYPLIY